MKKRILAVLLTVITAMSLMACSGSGAGAGSGSGADSGTGKTDAASSMAAGDTAEGTGHDPAGNAVNGTDSAAGTPSDNGETYNVIMQIVTFGQEFTGIAQVEAAINAITEPEIGVTVTLAPVAAWDLPTTSALEITSNEKLDLMCILPMSSGLDSIANYAGKNMLTPLDDLYAQYGQDIKSCIGELEAIGYYGGSLYAIPANYLAGTGYAFVARQDILDELGFKAEDKYYTEAELTELFAAYKAAYGDGNYAVAAFGNGDPFTTLHAIDNLGTDLSDGVLMNGGLEDTQVVNVFETEEYKNYAKTAREWYTAGYFNPDVATITDDWVSLIGGGNYLGAFTGVTGDGMNGLINNEMSCGYDLTALHIIDDYATTGIAAYGMWAIPSTCENPEKTMQFLNLLYQDRELANDVDSLLACGLEGTCYTVAKSLGGSKAIIDYPEGVSAGNVPFEQTLPIYGNELTVPQRSPLTEDIYAKYETYNQSIADAGRYSKAFGYTFDASAVANQKAALQSVINQYRPLLSYGTVDPEKVLPEFINAMKEAGIDEVVAENQKQLDQWLAAK